MRVTIKGQVTIPQQIREKLGIKPHTEVDFVAEGERVYLVKAPPKIARRGHSGNSGGLRR